MKNKITNKRPRIVRQPSIFFSQKEEFKQHALAIMQKISEDYPREVQVKVEPNPELKKYF